MALYEQTFRSQQDDGQWIGYSGLGFVWGWGLVLGLCRGGVGLASYV